MLFSIQELIERRIGILIVLLNFYDEEKDDILVETCLLLTYINYERDNIEQRLLTNYTITLLGILRWPKS